MTDLGRTHFIAIGGIGMSGIARILLARGESVTGSDSNDGATVAALRDLGATVHIGYSAGNIADPDTVVVSTAIREDNPELTEARRRGLRVIHRADALAAVMAGRRGVAVTGTNGKTTTTSMLTSAIRHCGADPSFAIGGGLGESGVNGHEGAGDLFIVEADESDGSFLKLAPEAAIVTNVEVDHLDQHGTPEAYARTFVDFLDRILAPGIVVCCADDPGSLRLAETARGRVKTVRTYGESPTADLQITDLRITADGTTFGAVIDGGAPVPVTLPVTGRHQAANAAGVLLLGLELGLPLDGLVAGLAAYGGVQRRFERKGVAGGVTVYDDYAHHPTKVTAQLTAARVVAGDGRLIVVFQPHLFSRTRDFAAEFGQALGLADEVVILPVFAAREDPMPGVDAELIASRIPLPAQQVHRAAERIPELVASLARPGDLVITMGAGDVTALGPRILAALGGAAV
ncbi:MAG TPA: UDP-N-acetylmuramate--L-alanine ligase [Mycobacteriales bacterium]|nr:UDP-N-acetylmuramate--L-alanine ligase [Mycobacteriales bacterium]